MLLFPAFLMRASKGVLQGQPCSPGSFMMGALISALLCPSMQCHTQNITQSLFTRKNKFILVGGHLLSVIHMLGTE